LEGGRQSLSVMNKCVDAATDANSTYVLHISISSHCKCGKCSKECATMPGPYALYRQDLQLLNPVIRACPALRTYLPARVLAQQGHAATRRPLYCTGDGQPRPTVLRAAHGWVVRHVRRQCNTCVVWGVVKCCTASSNSYHYWLVMKLTVPASIVHTARLGKAQRSPRSCAPTTAVIHVLLWILASTVALR
jgi:hypothetical protein